MVGACPNGSRVERPARPRRLRRLNRDQIAVAQSQIVAWLNKRGVTLADAGAILNISETKACRLKSAAGHIDPSAFDGLLGASPRGIR